MSFAKKIISFILLVVMLASLSAPLLVVNSASGHETHLDPNKELPTMRENSVNYTCRFDEKNNKVLVSGTVNHGVMIEHRDFFLDVYAVAPDQSVEEAVFSEDAESKASMEIAIKFDFSISALTMTDRFSRYAVVLRSADGEKILGDEPQYIHVASTYEYDDAEAMPYKGISSELTTVAASVNAGTAILPVYLNRLISNNTGGMVYPLEDGFCYFDRSYVEELDARTRTYSASGTRVYFQLLLEANGSSLAVANGQSQGAKYDLPDLLKKENLQQIAAAAEFLAGRYDEKQSGVLSGLVVGSSLDRGLMNYSGLSLEKYAERYAFYLLTVANAARMKNSALDVLLPFSEVDGYSDPSLQVAVGDYSPSLLLEKILSVLNDRLNGSFACGTMIESSVLPLTWSEEKNAFVASNNQNTLGPDSLSWYESYLKALQRTTRSAPTHFVYRWKVPTALEGDALTCTYAYSYYRLLQYDFLSSFVVSFDGASHHRALGDLQQILRYIDTEQGMKYTKPLLTSFGEKSWESVLAVKALSAPAVRNVYRLLPASFDADSYEGSFEYFDFSSATLGDWFAGVDCKRVRLDNLDNSVRTLRSVMANKEGKGASELLCLYEFSENFIYTPHLKLALEMTDDIKNSNALYEITVTFGNHQTLVLAEQLVPSGELCEIWLDLSEIPAEALMTEYIKIGVELVEGEAQEFSLWVFGLTGYSEEYTSEELAELIQKERLRIRNENAEEGEEQGAMTVLWIVFGALLLISSVVVGAILFVRRKDDLLEEESGGDEKNRS